MTPTVNMPTAVPPSVTLLGYVPDEVPHSTPLVIMGLPPSVVISPPRVAVVDPTVEKVGESTTGGVFAAAKTERLVEELKISARIKNPTLLNSPCLIDVIMESQTPLFQHYPHRSQGQYFLRSEGYRWELSTNPGPCRMHRMNR